MLQFNDIRVDQRKEPCIRVNIKELNRELSTELSTLYTKSLWFMLYYFSSTTLAYSKWPCVSCEVNMCYVYYIILLSLNLLLYFLFMWLCDCYCDHFMWHVTCITNCVTVVWHCDHDIIWNLNPITNRILTGCDTWAE